MVPGPPPLQAVLLPGGGSGGRGKEGGGTREGGRQQPTPVSLLRCLCSPVEQHPISKSSLLDSFCSNCSESELWLSKSVPVSSVVSPPGLEVSTGGSSTSCHLKPQPPTYLLKVCPPRTRSVDIPFSEILTCKNNPGQDTDSTMRKVSLYKR